MSEILNNDAPTTTSSSYPFEVMTPPGTGAKGAANASFPKIGAMGGKNAKVAIASLVAGWYTLTATIDAPPTQGATESWLTARMSIVPAPATIVLLGISGLRTARRRW